jgi:type IV secretion system protein VirB1
MDATTFMALVALCAPLVDPSTAQAIVATESSFNPHAIGVVAGALQRQPRNAQEALATAADLRARSLNFSVGLAQINVRNLDRFGMSLVDGFDACKNLQAMQEVLGECHERAGASAAQARLCQSCREPRAATGSTSALIARR